MRKACRMAMGVAVAVLALNSMALAQMVNVKTEKTVYLMDPYYWVYEAARVTSYWLQAGYERDVNFTVRTFDDIGRIQGLGNLYYKVLDGAVLLKNGALTATVEAGVYTGTFRLSETDVGRDLFTGQQPKELTLQILDSRSLAIKKQKVYVGRWGCDRCHVAPTQARKLYSWCNPTGNDANGPHAWKSVLGGAYGSVFDGSILKDATRVHSPKSLLIASAGHEKTIRKGGGSPECSPCHQGSGHVRYDYRSGEGIYPWVAYAKSEGVECTFCHGMEGGYVPSDGTMWVDNAGYFTLVHRHNNVTPLPDSVWAPTTISDPWLARQNCANPGCHGHINRSPEKRAIDQAKPDCRRCHGIHNYYTKTY
ncbi:MAG: hypothetical protein V1800_16605 [Candidatus Latescibacterota bacterium]